MKKSLVIDANLDRLHPDPGAWVILLCHANRQRRPGIFPDLRELSSALGEGRLQAALERRDLFADGGVWRLAEGLARKQDPTGAERMRRYRENIRLLKKQGSEGCVTRNGESVTRNGASRWEYITSKNVTRHSPTPPISTQQDIKQGTPERTPEVSYGGLVAPVEPLMPEVSNPDMDWADDCQRIWVERRGGEHWGICELAPAFRRFGRELLLAGWAAYLDSFSTRRAGFVGSPRDFASKAGVWCKAEADPNAEAWAMLESGGVIFGKAGAQ